MSSPAFGRPTVRSDPMDLGSALQPECRAGGLGAGEVLWLMPSEATTRKAARDSHHPARGHGLLAKPESGTIQTCQKLSLRPSHIRRPALARRVGESRSSRHTPLFCSARPAT